MPRLCPHATGAHPPTWGTHAHFTFSDALVQSSGCPTSSTPNSSLESLFKHCRVPTCRDADSVALGRGWITRTGTGFPADGIRLGVRRPHFENHWEEFVMAAVRRYLTPQLPEEVHHLLLTYTGPLSLESLCPSLNIASFLTLSSFLELLNSVHVCLFF